MVALAATFQAAATALVHFPSRHMVRSLFQAYLLAKVSVTASGGVSIVGMVGGVK